MFPSVPWLRRFAIVVLLGVASVSCRAQVTVTEVARPLETSVTPSATEPALTRGPGADPATTDRVNFALFRTDIECGRDDLATAPSTSFVTSHVVVDGVLGTACLGEPDPRLLQAWHVLVSITPPAQLSDLALFAGFESFEAGETTLAFVNSLDTEATQFQMSVNLTEAATDPSDMQLTMAHEFSHVFTSLPSELDRYQLPDECRTWDNGEGCYHEGSLMWEWIRLFWTDNMILSIDPFGVPSSDDGAQRCLLDASFLGPYAASSPEEDFAESFSAFVFRLEVRSPSLQRKMNWFASQPGLAEFRDRAIASGLGPLPNSFETCG